MVSPRQERTRSRRMAFALTVVAALAAACGGGYTSQGIRFTDPDGDMSTANGLIFETPPVDDRLNPSAGDREDWRYIVVPSSGMLSVVLNVDDPTMQGTWFLLDHEGRAIHTEQLDPARGYYELPNRPVLPGRYHFRITADKGASVYTLGATFVPDPEPVVVAEPEPQEPVVVEEPEVHRRRDRRSSGETRRTRRTEEPVVEEDAGTAVSGTRRVTGTISLATEKDDGTVEVTIRGVGTATGVDSGMKGEVQGLGVTVKTTSCSARKCSGVVKGASARDLRANDQVVFMAK